MSTSTINKSFDTVCDALRDVHDEASLWRLSDEIVKIAPTGVHAVDQIVEQAKARKIPTKSANTLRLYRDVAIRFPVAERVPLVSFSAHREAIVLGDAKQARKVLEELVKQHGAENVTVTTVKQAIGAATGNVKKAASKSKAGAGVATSYGDVVTDLGKGGRKFIAELDAALTASGVTLDQLHTGLSAVLAEVEARRAKAARKAAQQKAKPAPVVNPAKNPVARKAIASAHRNGSNGSKPAASGKVLVGAGKGGAKKGDLRDL